MKDSVIAINEPFEKNTHTSSNGVYIELNEFIGDKKITKLDCYTRSQQPKLPTTNLYEIILQSIRFIPLLSNSNKVSPLTNDHVVLNTPSRDVNLNKYMDCPPNSFITSSYKTVNKYSCNVPKNPDNPCIKIKTLNDIRRIEYIPLNTFSLVEKENMESLTRNINQSILTSSRLYDNAGILGNGKMVQVVKNPHASPKTLWEETCETYCNDLLYNEVENQFDQSVMKNVFTDEADGSIELGNNIKSVWLDKPAGEEVERIELGENIKDAWRDKLDGNIESQSNVIYSEIVTANEVTENKTKWTNILQKVKCHIHNVKETFSTRNNLLHRKTKDEWTVTIPTSLLITTKDSDWSTQINDIEESRISEDIWRQSTSEMYVANDRYTQWSTKLQEIKNNNNFELDPWEITLRNISDNQGFPESWESILSEIEKRDMSNYRQRFLSSPDLLCTEIGDRDWTVSISNIRPTNRQDDVWSTVINAIRS